MGDTLSLTFVNATNSQLTLVSSSGCNNPGPAPAAIPANGTASTLISGHNVAGFINYTDGHGVTLIFNFEMPAVYVPGTDNAFSFSCSNNNSYVAVISGTPMSGSSATITVLIETPAEAVVTLASDYSNTHDFVQSMFATNARGTAPVFAAAEGPQTAYTSPTQPPPFTGSFANWTSIQRIVSLWTGFWQGGQPAPGQGFLQTDAVLLQSLSSYIGDHLPVLWVPQLQFKGWVGAANASKPIYYVTGYTSYDLKYSDGGWNANNVSIFLLYFLYGAHTVLVLDPTTASSQTIAPDLYNTLGANNSPVYPNLAQQVWDSHYSSVGGQDSGMSYPLTIDYDSVPAQSPLLCSFLIGPTVQPVMFLNPLGDTTQRCNFLQLEGWRQFGQASAGWHDADYDSYTETYWNYSTYGVSAFSEKRGTALFLAPAGWTPSQQCATLMPAYLGALSTSDVNPWMQWSLVSTPAANQSTVATVTGVASGSTAHFHLNWDAVCSISVIMPAGISATLMHVNGGAGKDNDLGQVDGNTILAPGVLQYGNYNYYLTNPVGATSNYSVAFTACG